MKHHEQWVVCKAHGTHSLIPHEDEENEFNPVVGKGVYNNR